MGKTTTQMQLVPLSKLVPYVNNARTHSPEQITKLRSSLREFGFVNPVIIDQDYGIIAGHGRVLAAKEEGIEEVPCVFVDYLTEAQKKAYILADNRFAQDAGWDEDLLRIEIESLQGADFDVSLTGFDPDELADLFADDNDGDVKDDAFDLSAALEKAAFVKKGDIWTAGRHRLMCGDATNAEDVAALMDGKRANLVVTDPPYGVSFKSSDGLTIENDSMKGDEFYQFLLAAFKNVVANLEKGGAAYVFHADTEGLNFRRAFQDAGFHLAGCCIWVKNSLVLGRSDYQWQHEPVLYGFLQNGKHPWYSDRKQTTIWNYDKPKRNKNHPTSKPLDLLGYPICNSSQENGIVIDTFGGSGSTMMACEQSGRICYMLELDEKYGVYQVTKDECKRCVLDALKAGYRSIDTAQSYFNEEEVGEAIRESGIPREEIFLTTKVWIEHYGEESARASVLESMRKLQTDYLDLVLLHQPFGDAYGAWRALEALYEEGKIRAIGISNFYVDRMVEFANFNRIRPMITQMCLRQNKSDAKGHL